MSDFRPGDNVVLKSGGPTMTVSAVEGGKVICIRVGDEKSMQEPFEPRADIGGGSNFSSERG
jgi:uncharacterized protein YodC (DUF2158 family)